MTIFLTLAIALLSLIGCNNESTKAPAINIPTKPLGSATNPTDKSGEGLPSNVKSAIGGIKDAVNEYQNSPEGQSPENKDFSNTMGEMADKLDEDSVKDMAKDKVFSKTEKNKEKAIAPANTNDSSGKKKPDNVVVLGMMATAFVMFAYVIMRADMKGAAPEAGGPDSKPKFTELDAKKKISRWKGMGLTGFGLAFMISGIILLQDDPSSQSITAVQGILGGVGGLAVIAPLVNWGYISESAGKAFEQKNFLEERAIAADRTKLAELQAKNSPIDPDLAQRVADANARSRLDVDEGAGSGAWTRAKQHPGIIAGGIAAIVLAATLDKLNLAQTTELEAPSAPSATEASLRLARKLEENMKILREWEATLP